MMKKIFLILLAVILTFPLLSQEQTMLEIRIEGLRNMDGKLRITLFDNADGFPENREKSFTSKTIDLDRNETIFRFSDLKPGEYAYAILHDEDGNGKMNKNLIGMPKEGFGFSSNYRPKVKNPSFEDAAVSLQRGRNVHRIEIIYFL